MVTRANRLAACVLMILAPVVSGAQGARSDFNERVLAAHNRERARLSLPSMRWNNELAADAKRWSDYLARSGRFEHSSDSPDQAPQGENLWAGTPGHYQPEAMVGLWVAEKRYFKPGVFPANSRTGKVEDVGHYTQVMWRGSRQLGCALSRGQAEEVLVCRYSDAGNVLGEVPF